MGDYIFWFPEVLTNNIFACFYIGRIKYINGRHRIECIFHYQIKTADDKVKLLAKKRVIEIIFEIWKERTLLFCIPLHSQIFLSVYGSCRGHQCEAEFLLMQYILSKIKIPNIHKKKVTMTTSTLMLGSIMKRFNKYFSKLIIYPTEP